MPRMKLVGRSCQVTKIESLFSRDIKDITIQDIMIMNKHKELIKIYFGLGKINFTRK